MLLTMTFHVPYVSLSSPPGCTLTDPSTRLILVTVGLTITPVVPHRSNGVSQVTALATGQFVIELLDTPPSPSASSNHEYVPHPHAPPAPPDPKPPMSSFSAQEYLMGPPSSPPSSVMLHAVTTRPRAKSRAKPPSAIFIHPAQSNLARADAAALELGLGGDTERVRAPGAGRGAPAWAHGHGPQAARALLGNARRSASEKDPERRPLYAHDSDSDERD